MWSGPRNISTAMMRAFENRPDTVVIDEPFYAAFLAETGADHPMREAVIAAGPTNPAEAAARLLAPLPPNRTVFYQKHMTHHMVAGFPRGWMDHPEVVHAFLIRRPENVLASYRAKREVASLSDIGFIEQAEIFERVADQLGAAPPVIDAGDVLADPRGTLGALCAAVGIAFREEMLAWPAGRRQSDGVWAAHWYATVEASTGFAPPRPDVPFEALSDELKPVAEAARPIYERLARHRLRSGTAV
jgi:hypothetical protein